MSNENYNVEIKEEKCLCHSKWFKKFLMSTLGTFLGVYFALCLFSAFHKPPMMPACPCACGCPMMRQAMYNAHHYDRMQKGDFVRKNYERKAPVRVEIDE